MGFQFKDLPVYILMAAVIGFFIYIMIESRKEDKNNNGKDDPKK